MGRREWVEYLSSSRNLRGVWNSWFKVCDLGIRVYDQGLGARG
jgi:hypothetical protein